MSSCEWNGFIRHCKKLKYSCHGILGPQDSVRPLGGTAILVHRTVRHSPANSMSSEGVQITSVWVQGFRVINVYSPPGHQEICLHYLTRFWEQHRVNTAPWMVVGDFNDPPETSSLSSFFASQGAKLLGDGKEPTRWDGTRCIDWAMACAPIECFPVYQGLEQKIHISDHIGLRFLLNVDARYPWRGRLGTAPI